MIKPELYHKTVGILYDAYFNDTLEHANCYACAVGNLVAAGCGYKFERNCAGVAWVKMPYPADNGWARVFCGGDEIIDPENFKGLALLQIKSTGYSIKQLARIEAAFENKAKGFADDERMFTGLVAVLEVLKDIHQVADEDLLQANNKRFKDHYAKRVSAV